MLEARGGRRGTKPWRGRRAGPDCGAGVRGDEAKGTGERGPKCQGEGTAAAGDEPKCGRPVLLALEIP